MPKVSPDVILLDVRMPEMDGLVALAKLKELLPQASVLMVTLYDDTDYLLKAVSSGAAGYVLKDASREELVRAIRITAGEGLSLLLLCWLNCSRSWLNLLSPSL